MPACRARCWGYRKHCRSPAGWERGVPWHSGPSSDMAAAAASAATGAPKREGKAVPEAVQRVMDAAALATDDAPAAIAALQSILGGGGEAPPARAPGSREWPMLGHVWAAAGWGRTRPAAACPASKGGGGQARCDFRWGAFGAAARALVPPSQQVPRPVPLPPLQTNRRTGCAPRSSRCRSCRSSRPTRGEAPALDCCSVRSRSRGALGCARAPRATRRAVGQIRVFAFGSTRTG